MQTGFLKRKIGSDTQKLCVLIINYHNQFARKLPCTLENSWKSRRRALVNISLKTFVLDKRTIAFIGID